MLAARDPMDANMAITNKVRQPLPMRPQPPPPPINQPHPFFSLLPPGWSFNPSDTVIAKYYLFNKIYGFPLPPNKIVEVDIYKYDPYILAALYKAYEEDGKWYFFTPTEKKYKNGSRPSRSAGDGYWKATIAEKEVKENGEVLVLKKTLVYYRGKPRQSEKTDWIMYEFRLNNPPPRNRDDMKLDDWVLCQIHKRREGEAKRNKTLIKNETPAVFVPQGQGGCPQQTQEDSYRNSARAMPSEACPSVIQNFFVTCNNVQSSMYDLGDLQQPWIFEQNWTNYNVGSSTIGGQNYIEQQAYQTQSGNCYHPASALPPNTCNVGAQQHAGFDN